jgi:hypothetical protein
MDHVHTHPADTQLPGPLAQPANNATNLALPSSLEADLAAAFETNTLPLRWTQPEGTNIRIASANQPTAEQLADYVGILLAQPVLAQMLANARHRVLSSEIVEAADKHEALPSTLTPVVRVLIADYTNNQIIDATANFPDAAALQVRRTAEQPRPSAEEFDEAVELVMREEAFASYLICGRLIAYRPIPALVRSQGEDGSSERVLAVGLMAAEGANFPHQILAVNMATQRVSVVENAFPTGGSACGLTPVACQAPSDGTLGQLWISWPAVNPVWTFLAVRPSASSGVNGSGLEIRFAGYKGKRVLYRGHVPVLNVKYDNNVCGPYRDWQDEEHCFQVDGTNLAPGFRWSIGAPKTACNGSDAGNFSGIALNETSCELVLTTEMAAGWYRYIQEWRFHKDGTIRPRFKFAAVQNPCVCHAHVHHVYWRFDLDLNSAGNNLVEEYNNPPLLAGLNWHTQNFETSRMRNYGRNRKWRVRNTSSGETYELIPGPSDGLADAYGRADLWALRYRGNEIDDGGPVGGTEAHMDNYVGGESLVSQDVVLWYGAHFRHNVAEQGSSECHQVGPTLKPVQW